MRKFLFKKAKYLIENKKIKLLFEDEKSIRLKVNKQEVRYYYKDKNLKFWCTCKHASLKPELLCSHVIGGLIWLSYFHQNN